MGLRISGGQLASSQARVSLRNFSRSAIGRFHCKDCCADLSSRAQDFNMPLHRRRLSRADAIGYIGGRGTR
jgi:hypothetical protein